MKIDKCEHVSHMASGHRNRGNDKLIRLSCIIFLLELSIVYYF